MDDFGSWVVADELGSSRGRARNTFLQVVAKEEDKVLSSLAELMPAYERLLQFVNSGVWSGEDGTFVVEEEKDEISEEIANELWGTLASRFDIAHTGIYSNIRLPEDLKSEYSQLSSDLTSWSERWRLSNEWIVDSAVAALARWSECGIDKSWMYKSSLWIESVVGGFRFEYPVWNPSRDTWRSYEKKLSRAFDKGAAQYRKQKTASLAGGSMAIESRVLEHYVWLVQFQVLGLRNTDIFDQCCKRLHSGVDLSTVTKAIHRIADLIGLTLRPNRLDA